MDKNRMEMRIRKQVTDDLTENISKNNLFLVDVDMVMIARYNDLAVVVVTVGRPPHVRIDVVVIA